MSTPLPPDPATLPLLDARQLRSLGERADSYRGVEMYLVARPTADGTYEFDVRSAADIDAGYEAVMRIVTPAGNTPARQAPTVTITLDGVPMDPGALGSPDAVFLTQSAVEKFLFPYYEAMRVFDADYLPQLKADYYSRLNASALVLPVHFPPTNSAVAFAESTVQIQVTVGAPTSGA